MFNHHSVSFQVSTKGRGMTIEAMDEAEASSSTGPHRMRITSGGQVGGYVNFALSFLKASLLCPPEVSHRCSELT